MKTPSDFIYRKEFEDLNKKFKMIATITVDQFPQWKGERGRIQDFLKKEALKKGIDRSKEYKDKMNQLKEGAMADKFRKEVKPYVIPLDELGLGEEGRIVFITPKSHQRLDRLGNLGIVPGSVLRMHQKNPSHVLQLGETTIALDRDIVKDIYVKKV
jgi:Fe2+ transport system protein FeoA